MKNDSKQIQGTLEQIRFQNDSGFMIGVFRNKNGKIFSALGNIINPQVCLKYSLTGQWENNPKFGDQFKFESYETALPADHNGIYKYIVRVCKFVGTAVGNALVDRYQSNTLEIMKSDPEKIAREISGITLARAREIQKALLGNEKNEKVMVELEGLLDVPGMRKGLPAELVKIYKSNAAEVLRENPYILTELHGIGFPLADRVALHIGFARDSIFRKEAAALHVLQENQREGSTWITRQELLLQVSDLIQIKGLEKGIDSLVNKGIAISCQTAVALFKSAEDEKIIAKILMKLEAA